MREKAKSEVKRVRKSEYMRKKVTAYEVENAGSAGENFEVDRNAIRIEESTQRRWNIRR